ncbi:MAG: hypothetical protein KBT06_08950 [Prevotellaceae bacterium]|nr:hypothetical protein [Candidatus Colivivens equi]
MKRLFSFILSLVLCTVALANATNRKVVKAASTTVEQVTHYYPYGGVIGDISAEEECRQKYKFEGKELDRSFGLDNYDIHARNYFAMLPMWDRVDPLAEKYYGISPYAYCGGDPVNKGDYMGDSVCVLLKSEGACGVGHLAMLIQNEKKDNNWYLFSKNGYASSPSSESDLHKGVYSSPEEFMKQEADKGYTDAFVMDTGKGKDAIAMETMETEINKPYSLLFSNCAQAVQKTLQTIGLSPGYFMSAPNNNNIFPSQEEFIIRNVLPIKTFENIKQQNSGREL